MADEPGLYRVEDLAAAAEVGVDTVRYYQSKNLLEPPARDGRVAWYGENHLIQLREIRDLARRGFTLAQISELRSGQADSLLTGLAAENRPDPALDRPELARRSGIGEGIIEIAISAGLLHPIATPDGDRFTDDTTEMLSAARTIVDEGVTLEELVALAMRHAVHVEDVVDDAIELFRRNHNQAVAGDPAEINDADDRAELAATVHRLVPAVSKLVATHFERTLIERALSRIGETAASESTTIVVAARKLAQRLDPLMAFAVASDHYRSFWQRPDEGLCIAGVGAVEIIEAAGAHRFTSVSAARVSLAGRIRRHGPADAPLPVLMGGFAFAHGADDRPPSWNGFPDSRWVLPELTVVDRADGTWILASGAVGSETDQATVVAGLEARIDQLLSNDSPGADVEAVQQPDGRYDDGDYLELVEAAKAQIDLEVLGKVVLARQVTASGRPDMTDALDGLRDSYPGCAVFAVTVGSSTFFGASPEKLVVLDGPEVRTVALAGTTLRGSDAESDRALADAMLASGKDRAEHQFVVDNITEKLATLGLVGETPDQPEILALARIQHLCTPITARVPRRAGGVSDLDVFRVAGVLHPTPAVGGTPTEAALSWIRDNEPFDRGWYAAPVGWCDLAGNGELRVALRSAIVDDDGVHLFAGAGIVAESEPEAELSETGAKLGALLDVLGS